MSLILNSTPFFDLLNKSFTSDFDDLLKSTTDSSLVPIDLVENDKQYELKASIPGAELENIAIDFDKNKNQIKVSANIPEQTVEKEENHRHYKEIRSGSFERTIGFGKQVIDDDNIKAEYKDGILKLAIPKGEAKEAENIKKIKIN